MNRFQRLLLMTAQLIFIYGIHALIILDFWLNAFLTERSFSFALKSVTSEDDYELDVFVFFPTEFRGKERLLAV